MFLFNTSCAQQDLPTGCAGNVYSVITTDEHSLSDYHFFVSFAANGQSAYSTKVMKYVTD